MRVVLLAALLATGCSSIMPRYLAQAAYGQVELLGKARKIEDVVADPEPGPQAVA